MRRFISVAFACLIFSSAAFAQEGPQGGRQSALNITTSTVVKAAPGRLATITVTTAGSAAGTANDTTTTGAAAAANLIFTIPNTAGVYRLDWPVLNGIVIVPGSGQVISVAYQ